MHSPIVAHAARRWVPRGTSINPEILAFDIEDQTRSHWCPPAGITDG
jgi:hypothetical protein